MSKNEVKGKKTTEIKGEVLAAIAMALHEYQGNNVHDVESNILTFNSNTCSTWSSKILTLRETPHRG